MKYFVIYFLVLLCSCNPCKRLVRLCPPNDSISYVETLDTIYVKVPENTSSLELPIDAIGLTQEDANQKVIIHIQNDTVFIRTTCKAQEKEILQLRTKLAETKTRIERIEIPKYVYRETKYGRISSILAPVFLFILLFFIYLRIKR